MTTLILTQKEDESTNDVMDWLNYFGVKTIRINFDEICTEDIIDINLNQANMILKLKVNNQIIDVDKIDSYWYRRGGVNLKKHQFDDENDCSIPKDSINEAIHNLKLEKKEILYIIHYILESKISRKIGSFFKSSVVKFEVLHKAALHGILTPSTYILNSKEGLIEHLNEKPMITKGIREGIRFNKKSYGLYSFTSEVKSEDLNQIPNTFFPSLIQEKLDKEYEIRSTFFNNQFYSMAILSQNDEQTKVDFRNYNHKKPNRLIPYEIPKDIKEKLSSLFKSLDLNFGSFDLVKTRTNQYVFLEVNPVGQFGMVTDPMNYKLEKEIAKFLAYEN